MNRFILDASVAFKWVVSEGEGLREEALELLDRYAKGRVRFVVPDLFWAEIGNILWKAVRQRRLSLRLAEEAIVDLRGHGFPTVGCHELLSEALVMADAFDRSVYDCLYIALAVKTKAHFVTADERLANAVAARLPVKWLGAL
jgi:predicted nucleic acid-binding protein